MLLVGPTMFGENQKGESKLNGKFKEGASFIKGRPKINSDYQN